MYEREVLQIPISIESWYYDLKYYLSKVECLDNINSKQRRALQLKFAQYHVINESFFRIIMMEFYLDDWKRKMLRKCS
jgi:hypothetical protein